MAKPAHTVKQIGEHYSQAFVIALTMIEERARKILREHRCLDEFVMSMGTAFFTTVDGGTISIDQRAYMKPVNDILEEWDEYLKLTGSPLRVTADGPRTTNW